MPDATFTDLAHVTCGCGSTRPARECCLDEYGRLVRPRPSTVSQKPASFEHPKCYARALGNCSDVISREHMESDVVLRKIASRDPDGLFIARGIRRLRADERILSPDSLTAKILCENHNNILSPYDAAGGRFFEALADSEQPAPSSPARVAFVNGYDVEKWMLKILCGNVATGDYRDPTGLLKTGEVPKMWVEALYGTRPWPSGWGIYFSGEAGDEADQGPLHLRTHLIVDSSIMNTPIGVRCTAAGFAFSFLVVANYPALRIAERTYRPGRINLRYPPDTPPTILGLSWWPSHIGATATIDITRRARDEAAQERL